MLALLSAAAAAQRPCLQGFFLYMPILADKREDYVPDENKK